jgi:O-antigen ligase
LLGAVFAVGALGLLMTFSRAAQIGLIAGVLVVLALLAYRRHWPALRIWLAAALAAAVLCAAFVKPYSPYLGSRVNPTAELPGSTEARALSERSALARLTNDIFVGRPLTGVGIGALPVAMHSEQPDFRYNYQPAHFVLLDVAAETGILGAFFYGSLLVTPWLLLWWRRQRLSVELIGISGALLAVGVVGLLDYYTWSIAPGRIWAWVVLGLWVGAYARSLRGSETDA